MAASYDHTQRGYFHWLLYLLGLACLLAVWFARHDAFAILVVVAVGALLIVSAASFHYLRVVDAGDRLLLQFGPLPLLRGSIPYKSMIAVEADRSLLIDGWGIHWIPGRGWTYNIWGFDSVLVTLDNGKMMRVGSDDAENLLAFLQTKLKEKDIPIG